MVLHFLYIRVSLAKLLLDRLLCAIGTAGLSLSIIRDADGPFQIGVGTVPGRNDISPGLSQLATVLAANSPQLFCSYIFLSFNYVLTSIYAGYRWITYSQRRQPLRVTNPIGYQHSTYFLQLPYRFSTPLLAISGVLSWLTSQILFVVRVETMDTDGRRTERFISTSGYSPGAIAITMIVGTVLTIAVLIVGLKRLPDTMPLAGTNSAAIAAACHALPKDENCATKPLKWGVVSDEGNCGHCSFSAGEVKSLVAGRIYR